MSLKDLIDDINRIGIPLLTAIITASSVFYIFAQMNWPEPKAATMIMFVFAFAQAWGKTDLWVWIEKLTQVKNLAQVRNFGLISKGICRGKIRTFTPTQD